MTRILALTLGVFFVAGCKLNVPAEKAADPAPARELVAAPPAFNQVATNITGAVRNAKGETLAVGTTRDGEPVIGKYEAGGTASANYPVYHPFAGSYRAQSFGLKKIAVLPDGFLVLGSYGKSDLSSAFFAFKLSEDGYLDLTFGPLRDGVVRETANPNIALRDMETPIVQTDVIQVGLIYFNSADGSAYNKKTQFAINGREAMAKSLSGIPAQCGLLNWSSTVDGVFYQFSQNVCDVLNFHFQDGSRQESLPMRTDGSTLDSIFFGEFAFHYETQWLILTSRDRMGHVKNEYAQTVQGVSPLCGNTVALDQSFLVFSLHAPNAADWLTDCWAL